MFPRNTEPDLEAGVLRSGRIFRSGKRGKTQRGRWNHNLFKGSKHEIQSYEDEGSYDEEEEYSPILEGPKDYEDSVETPRSGRNYITLG